MPFSQAQIIARSNLETLDNLHPAPWRLMPAEENGDRYELFDAQDALIWRGRMAIEDDEDSNFPFEDGIAAVNDFVVDRLKQLYDSAVGEENAADILRAEFEKRSAGFFDYDRFSHLLRRRVGAVYCQAGLQEEAEVIQGIAFGKKLLEAVLKFQDYLVTRPNKTQKTYSMRDLLFFLGTDRFTLEEICPEDRSVEDLFLHLQQLARYHWSNEFEKVLDSIRNKACSSESIQFQNLIYLMRKAEIDFASLDPADQTLLLQDGRFEKHAEFVHREAVHRVPRHLYEIRHPRHPQHELGWYGLKEAVVVGNFSLEEGEKLGITAPEIAPKLARIIV